ncbi:MAG TPA: ABC transporter ATP-binding protein [Propionibacteriaceae bacterium]|nr:ABC transporter ATP-binding protein [Propionibacteriaceae bacterium]
MANANKIRRPVPKQARPVQDEGRPAARQETRRPARDVVLSVSHLTKKYGPNVIVEDFNLQVHAGEAVALTGRNGAGKSTVLRCIVGADRPTEGTVEVLGTRMNETNADIRRTVATVIDDLDFFPDLSVVEHLDLLARAHGLDEADALVDEVLEEVQLVPQSGQLPGTLSSGQRRRLALATAFVRPRKLLILDEPEQRLDTEGIAWLGRRLRSELDEGLAIVMASHEPSLVEALGCRIVELGGPRG